MRGWNQAGFTLVELVVTLTVLGVLAALAAPSFADLIDRNRVRGQLLAIVDVLEFARNESLKRSTTTSGSSNVAVVFQKTNSEVWTVTASHDGESKRVESVSSPGVKLLDGTAEDASSSLTLNYDFRGIAGGTGLAKPITVRSPKGKELVLQVNALGRVTVCSMNGSVWGFASC